MKTALINGTENAKKMNKKSESSNVFGKCCCNRVAVVVQVTTRQLRFICDKRVVELRNRTTGYAHNRLRNGSVSIWGFTPSIRYDTRCYFNVRSKADTSQLNLPHGNDN